MEKVFKQAARSLAEKVTSGKMADAVQFYAEVMYQVSTIKRHKEKRDEADRKAMIRKYRGCAADFSLDNPLATTKKKGR